MSIWTIVALILGYFVRHFDPTGFHTPEGPLELAAKELDKQTKAQNLADLMAKLKGSSTPPTPPAS